MNTPTLLATALLIAMTDRSSLAQWTQVYLNAFESPVGPEWSNPTTARTPLGDRGFLGRFSGSTATTLSLASLPSHNTVTVCFDLFIIQSWDGNDELYGPDFWDLSVLGGPRLLLTTFSAVDRSPAAQAYPDSFPGGNHPAGTGASETNSLGYPPIFDPGPYMDSVYHLQLTFPHSSSTLSLVFSSANLLGMGDESWGLDNVTLSLAELSPPSITRQPVSRTNAVGTAASFTVEATATLPLSYQWRRQGTNLVDGGNISGVTTTNLVIANVQPADAVGYSVVVTNLHGGTTSQVAQLTLGPAPPEPVHLQNCHLSAGQFAFELDGGTGGKVLIQASTDLKHWVTLHACQLTNAPWCFIDTESHLYPRRYYRLMAAEGVALMEQPRWGSGQFNCNLVGEPGRLVVVVASTNLLDWTPLSLNTLGSAPLSFTDPQSAQFPHRFYQLLMP